ncbi:some similarities with Saccharomyces cerevisiae YHR097C Putative protein of unknown function [Maudiozyma barnettii]|uniref:Uncharacterized protein n=1 Tax=Maudiozyma barnettii TaxID=61262 RepID=A0A8H2VB49_9SACH|nr:Pal2p [Kazachstania barnettii]CAB4252016.1 some similarities with Saccharomyces cerevisiae YHR097C Putative protein of unknown function [Kazachstania barnettii]CAD1778449.1 some similarities with Saccharomyces cerevisiae YHR097C Putative protein of unknown function [Kazachstania barnettii]
MSASQLEDSFKHGSLGKSFKNTDSIKNPETAKKGPRKLSINSDTNMDVIDKLDQSGFPGLPFHHDGPFDVISPGRNSRDNKNAPILAFPNEKNEPIVSIPKRTHSKREEKIDIDILDDIFGANDVDDDDSYMTESDSFRDNSESDIMEAGTIHGSYTEGLGTSTFLDGTGAPSRRADAQRKQASSELLIDFSNENDKNGNSEENGFKEENKNLKNGNSTNYERFSKDDNLIDLDNTITERTIKSRPNKDNN